jgi:tRNA A37 N6-isopentenylltransferase MiaA
VRPLAIVGPTGTGKSQLALEAAERLGGEIVNADAMQFYRGMDIGTAKLPVAQRRGIPHHQLDVLDVTATATVARYQRAAAADIEAIAARGNVPVLVGGSMLYIQSLLDEWSFPATEPTVRAKWVLCTPSSPSAIRPRRRRSWRPTADASCAHSRWWNSPANPSPRRRPSSAPPDGTRRSSD